LAEAAEHQEEAADQLDKARSEVANNRPLSDEQKQQLADLGKREQQLAEEILRLAEEIERSKNPGARQALEQANSEAQRAAQALDRADDEEAEAAERNAEQKLEEAKQRLEEERNRYMNLRHEELLFRIVEELKEFQSRQEDVSRQTRELDAERGEDERLRRSLRSRLRGIAQQEKELADKAKFLREALEQEGSQVFSFVLRANQEDLEQVNTLMGGAEQDTGDYVQGLQKDVEKRTAELLAALKKEMNRRQDEGQNQDQQQNPQQNQNSNEGANKPKLVPDIAELKMLKLLEEDILDRTQQFRTLYPNLEFGELTEYQRNRLDRLAHRHNQITEIFSRFMKLLGIEDNPQQPSESAKKDGGK
jgi:hypothetical protein